MKVEMSKHDWDAVYIAAIVVGFYFMLEQNTTPIYMSSGFPAFILLLWGMSKFLMSM